MKTVSYTALHYGSDYLYWALRSVADYVDECWILYAATGSHGYKTRRPCPDQKGALRAKAIAAAGRKVHWVDGDWTQEHEQREAIYDLAPDADVILVLDADEIWPDNMAKTIVDTVRVHGTSYRAVRLPMIHYWRSFYRCVLHDPAFPERVIIGKADRGGYVDTWSHMRPINHMGYAQRSEIVEYKQHTHGHRGEWRKDIDWYQARFLANAQVDCHPVGSQYWNPEAVNPWDYLPAFMKGHPYAGLELIP